MPTDTAAEDPGVALLNTSAAIALLIEDHEAHGATLDAVRGRRLGLAGHAWFETYSVLTRLPAPLRRSPADAGRLLAHNFPATAFLGEAESAALGDELVRLGVSGGSVYDALVGAAARQHRRPLVTADVRARSVYEGLGVEIESVS
jgi:predicted nucleic acid-binding protein